MEPLSSLAAGYVTGRLSEVVESAIRSHVVERWGRHRAQQFFSTFCEAVAPEGTPDTEVKRLLDELFSDERRSEILFDACRSVCLARSKNIGPRVIALLTAKLVTGGSQADEEEAGIFAAAEELTDPEMLDFSETALRLFRRAESSSKEEDDTFAKNGSLCVRMGLETFTTSWHGDRELSVAPLDLANDIGTWAPKLKRHGLLSDDVRERQWEYRQDCELHIDEDGTARQVSWWLYFPPVAKRFAELIERVA